MLKKTVSFFLLVLLFFLSGNYLSPAAAVDSAAVKYTLISDKKLEEVNEYWGKRITKLFGPAQETFVQYNTAEAEKYIAELNIKFIPFVIFDKGSLPGQRFSQLYLRQVIQQDADYYILPRRMLKTRQIMFLSRSREPNTLVVFSRGLDQATQEAEVKLINFNRQNKLNLNIQVKFPVDVDRELAFAAVAKDVQEQQRQAIIQKDHPDKFLDYLIIAQEKGPEEAQKELGLPLAQIEAKNAEANQILKNDWQLANELEIPAVPSFLWENLYLFSDFLQLKQIPPFDSRKGVISAKADFTAAAVMIDFFYSESCHSCQKVKEQVLPQLKEKYQDRIEIRYHNISDQDELALKFAMEKEYGILGGLVPQVYLPTVALEGPSQIAESLPLAVEQILRQKVRALPRSIIPGESPILDKFSSFSPVVVTLAGLIDGINPCAFATIIFFISLLSLNSYRKRQIIYIGSAFISAVFLTYLGLGFGIFQILHKLQIVAFFSRLVYYAIAFLALGLGVFSFCDYIYYKRTGLGLVRGCNLAMYQRLRTIVNSKKGLGVIIGLSLVNGFIIAILESACTGQVYFPTIAFVLKLPNLRLHGLLYLLLYNLAFIFPLIIIFVLGYRGLTSEKVNLLANRHLGAVKLTTSLLFLGLAAALLMF